MKLKGLAKILASASLLGLLGCINQPSINDEAYALLKSTEAIREALCLQPGETCNIKRREGANTFIVEIKRGEIMEYRIYADEDNNGIYEKLEKIRVNLKIQSLPENPLSPQSKKYESSV